MGRLGSPLSGNPFAVLGAGIGGIGAFVNSDIFQSSLDEWSEFFDEMQKARDAVAEFTAELGDDLGTRRLRALGDDPAARALEADRQAQKELEEALKQLAEGNLVNAALPRGQRPADGFFETATVDQLREFLAGIEDQAHGASGALADFLKALIDLKEVQELERAAREAAEEARKAAEAERAAAEARERARQATQDRLSVEGREAALRGDDRGAFVLSSWPETKPLVSATMSTILKE